MLHHISWNSYFLIAGILLLAYYLFIGLKYYSGELKQYFQRHYKRLDRDNDRLSTAIQSEDEDNFQLNELILTLKLAISFAASKKLIREEFIQHLQMVVKKFNFLKSDAVKVIANRVIQKECEDYGYITLSVEDSEMIWNEWSMDATLALSVERQRGE